MNGMWHSPVSRVIPNKNSLTISPTSVAAQGYVSQDRSKGISLRFPRFIRVREDKGIHDASDPSFIAKLWQVQEQKGQGHKGADDGELIDYVEEEDEEDEEDEEKEEDDDDL